MTVFIHQAATTTTTTAVGTWNGAGDGRGAQRPTAVRMMKPRAQFTKQRSQHRGQFRRVRSAARLRPSPVEPSRRRSAVAADGCHSIRRTDRAYGDIYFTDECDDVGAKKNKKTKEQCPSKATFA